MYRLNLTLSDRIQAQFTAYGKNFYRNRFAIHSSFIIKQILVNGISADFHTVRKEHNYQIISFSADLPYQSVEIAYHGSFDYNNPIYPYVKENLSDKFYILRNETVYYPTFEIPMTEEFYQKLLFPLPEDSFQAEIKLMDSRKFYTNLKEHSDSCYIGTDPTIVVGNYQSKTFSFGTVRFMEWEEKQISGLKNIILLTNRFMKRYKQADISGLQIIELPVGYGSFVLSGTLFLTADSAENYPNLIHECIHTNWNPKCDVSVQRTRFFDEAITQYFTARLCDTEGILPRSEWIKQWKKECKETVSYLETSPTPLVDWGKSQQSDLAYSFGGLALFALEQAVGTAQMDRILRNMLTLYSEKEIDFPLFRSLFPSSADSVFHDYFNTVNALERLLKEPDYSLTCSF